MRLITFSGILWYKRIPLFRLEAAIIWELALEWILLFWQTTKWKWEKVKKKWQVLGLYPRTNTWKWQWYRLLSVYLERSPSRLEELEICRRIETIQTTALFRKDKIVKGFLQIWEGLLSLRPQWRTLVWKTPKE